MIGRIGGHRILDKLSKRFRVPEKLLLKLENYVKKHSAKAIFLTRVTYGLGIVVLIIAGSFRMKWKRFLIVNLIGTIVWVFGAVAVGYVFGISYSALGKITRSIAVGLTIVLFIAIVFLSLFIFHWLMRKAKLKFMKRVENNRFKLFRKIGSVVSYLINGKDEQKK
jgi:membrane protein DedA with SNARE-associated domain